MKINHAVIHVLNFVSCANVYAQAEIPVDDKVAHSYVMKHVRKALNSLDNKRGEFTEDSLFAEEMQACFRGERDFVDLSEKASLEREAVRRVAKSHEIRTDTGIEITFPVEYSKTNEYMTFTSGPDGLISIELKNIAHIENR